MYWILLAPSLFFIILFGYGVYESLRNRGQRSAYTKFCEWLIMHHGEKHLRHFSECCRCSGTGYEEGHWFFGQNLCFGCKGRGYIDRRMEYE